MRFDFKWKKLILLLLLISFLMSIPSLASAHSIVQKKHVLILNSYHQGFTWTNEVTDGILKALSHSNLNLDISVEYMDWKNYPTDENLQSLRSLFFNKYRNRRIDVIISSDDAALDFSLKYRSELFSDAPVVFCGVNQVGYEYITAGHKNVTGILEKVDLEEVMQLAIETMPNLESIYVVYDNTESAVSTGQLALNAIKTINPKIKGFSLNNMTYQEVLEAVRQIPKNSAIFIASFYVDRTGESLSFEQFCELTSSASSVPVFNLYDFTVGHGAIGGSMLCGGLQGERAAEMAIRILNGEKPDSLPVSHEKTVRKLYDYDQLVRFKIPLNRIDPNSEMINRPFSFFDTYKEIVIGVIAVIILLLGFILILFNYIRKVKKAETEIKESHHELTKLYEELAVSKEEVKEQCNELEISRNRLVESEERYRLVLDGSNDMIWDVDLTSRETYFSDRWFDFIGYEKADGFTFSQWDKLLHPEDVAISMKAAKEHFKRKTPYYSCEYRLKCKNGEYKWFLSRGKALFNKNGKAIRFAGSLSDIDERKKTQIKLQESYQELEATYEELFATQAELSTRYEEMREYQLKLQQFAYFDTLTGLPNRLSLYEKMSRYFNEEPDETCALLFIDSDNFKFINDSMGHSFGDKFIIEIGRRLSSSLKERHNIFRLGGDEFIICYCGYKSLQDVERLAQEIIDSFNQPFEIDGSILYVTVSIGISLYPDHGKCPDELMRHADIAMYNAKASGKDKYVMYNHDLRIMVEERMDIEKNLRSALQNKEFLLYYQPQFDIVSGKISGFEALLRWNNPSLGMVPPLKFIGIAEETHLIMPIGEWVLENACLFLKHLHNLGFTNLTMAVNVSILQLLQENFVDIVLSVLEKTRIEPRFLELEITESILMQSYQTISNKLRRLKECGIKIALDDFGQGYSSLSYLKQLPINTLKIDKSFIDSIHSSDPRDNFIDTIVMMGHKMDLVVLAEGVETKEQMDYLVKHRCHKIQGYLISRPLPEEEALKLL